MQRFWEDAQSLANFLGSRRVALTNGCYDIIHTGHITFLTWLQRTLVREGIRAPITVAINSDTSVGRLKGPGRPVNRARDRSTVLLALRMVDFVVVFEEDTPLECIKTLRPIALAKGGDYADRKIVGEEFVPSIGGRVFKGPYIDGYSSTEVLHRCKVT